MSTTNTSRLSASTTRSNPASYPDLTPDKTRIVATIMSDRCTDSDRSPGPDPKEEFDPDPAPTLGPDPEEGAHLDPGHWVEPDREADIDQRADPVDP